MQASVKSIRLKVLSVLDYSRMLNVSAKTAAKYYRHDCDEYRVKVITCSLFAAIYKIDYVPGVQKSVKKGI